VALKGTGELGPDVTCGPMRVVGGPNGCDRDTGDRVSKTGAGGEFGTRSPSRRVCCRAIVLPVLVPMTRN